MGSLHTATIKDTPFYATDYKAYDASKAALNMLALNYARIVEEWGTGGRSNVVCPQLVKTNLTGYVYSPRIFRREEEKSRLEREVG